MSVGRWGALVLTLAAAAALRAEGTAEDLRSRGEALLAQGDWQAAEAALDAAVLAAPADARAWGLLATVRNALSKYAEGRAACDRALELDPANVRASFDLGVALFNLSRSSEAAAHFDAVLAADPRHADATWMRGHCALRAAEWDLAAGLFLAAAERGADRYRALGPLYAGIALASAGRKEEASSRLEEAALVAPTGVVGVMAQAYRERLQDPRPCETLLRPEDYLPLPGEYACAAHVDLPAGRLGRAWARVSLSPGFGFSADGPIAGLSERGFLQLVDLLCIESQVVKSKVEAVVVPGPRVNAPDILLVGGPDQAAFDPAARRALWLVLAAGIRAVDGTEAALASALEDQRKAVTAAQEAGVWGPLLASERAAAAASSLGAEAVLREPVGDRAARRGAPPGAGRRAGREG